MILRNFADEKGLLHCYRKDNGKLFSTKAGNTFFKNDLYAKSDEKGHHKDVSMEYELGRNVEAIAGPVVKKILRCARRKQKPNLTVEEKKSWDLFFYVQMRRTVESREAIDDKSLFNWAQRETNKRMGPPSAEEEEELMNAFGTSEKLRSAVDSAWIDGLLDQDNPLFYALRNKGLLIVMVERQENTFVIGSDPIVPAIPEVVPLFWTVR